MANLPLDITLDEPCDVCAGRGIPMPEWTQFSRADGSCGKCNGSGRVVRPFGREVLDFLRRHMHEECFKEAA